MDENFLNVIKNMFYENFIVTSWASSKSPTRAKGPRDLCYLPPLSKVISRELNWSRSAVT